MFTVTGLIGLALTLVALGSRPYRQLSARYLHTPDPSPIPAALCPTPS